METIGIRTKKIRNEKRLTQAELGKVIGVSKQAVANIESEHNKPSIDFIGKLIENLDINSNWYITGQGEMFNETSTQNEQLEKLVAQIVDKKMKERGL